MTYKWRLKKRLRDLQRKEERLQQEHQQAIHHGDWVEVRRCEDGLSYYADEKAMIQHLLGELQAEEELDQWGDED